MKLRHKPEKEIFPLETAISRVQGTISTLEAEIAAGVVSMEYNG
jgi:hypothetical protein